MQCRDCDSPVVVYPSEKEEKLSVPPTHCFGCKKKFHTNYMDLAKRAFLYGSGSEWVDWEAKKLNLLVINYKYEI